MELRQHRYRPLVLCLLCFICILTLGGCISSASQPFRLLSTGDLTYPEDAKQAQITGKVTVSYDIQIDGSVTNVSVIQAEPPGVFDSEALRYVRTWMFVPAMKNGVPQVSENVESEISFKLHELMEAPPDY